METSPENSNEKFFENVYFSSVEDDAAFTLKRERLHNALAKSNQPYRSGLRFLREVQEHKYAYQWSWLGVPIIKLPEDIVVLQEFFYIFRPETVIEVGVARGGSLKLYSSLQRMLSINPNILGIDVKFFPHSIAALEGEIGNGITLLEADSVSALAIQTVTRFVERATKVLMVLDGNHSHSHVMKELQIFGKILPIGSYIVVADTITEDLDLAEHNRPWGKGNNPKTALDAYLQEDRSWERDSYWGRRATISESRDGWIHKTGR